MRDEPVWLELRLYQRFQNKGQLHPILPKTTNVALFFCRKDDQTRIFVRTTKSQRALFEELDQIESLEVREPLFVYRYLKKVRLRHHYALPLNVKEQPTRLYTVLEQAGQQNCLLACYARRDPGGASSLWRWIESKERRHGQKKTARLQNILSLAKQKAKDPCIYQCEIILGADDPDIFDLLKTALPTSLCLRTLSQKRFSLRRLCRVRKDFAWGRFYPVKPPLWSSRFPILNTAELLNIISFPDDVSRLRLAFGSYVPYSQGPKCNIPFSDLGLDDPQIDHQN